jgi:beta-glucosidase
VPTVVVLMNGRPLAIPWIAENVPAIVEAWFLGIESGHAIADVLFGDFNPGGKLPVTFPRCVGQVPIYYSHKSTGRPPDEQLRMTSRYLDVSHTPLFSFGHGLSYTRFRYENLALSADTIPKDGVLKVSVDIVNEGERGGDEVVQLYVQDVVASVTRPVRELAAFRRVTIAAGDRLKVAFSLYAAQLSFYNRDMNDVVEPGEYRVFVGGDSVGGLEGRFRVE